MRLDVLRRKDTARGMLLSAGVFIPHSRIPRAWMRPKDISPNCLVECWMPCRLDTVIDAFLHWRGSNGNNTPGTQEFSWVAWSARAVG